MSCAASLEVQRIIREENLVSNVQSLGKLFETLLHQHLDGHAHVGNVRGKGLFWGVRVISMLHTAGTDHISRLNLLPTKLPSNLFRDPTKSPTAFISKDLIWGSVFTQARAPWMAP